VPPALTAPPASILQDKSEFRKTAFARRKALAEVQSPAVAGAAAAEQFLATLTPAPGSVLSAYWPMGDEIDPRPLIERLHARGVAICLPVVVAKGEPLVFRRWTPATRFVPGGFKTQVPWPDEPELTPALLVVPLLAFDRAGYRLGYGGGFYDRTLTKLRGAGAAVTAVGFAFAGQEVESVPHAAYDQRLDASVTERFFRRIA
jgi:5-formyltetrahydrofolate cyclo-ligase